ncbi:glycosyltransferase family 4 protein [Tepidiforma sp.]|uniref:glycosyltransferase family 4 protein n=1 Tax=Tepidiforma sp. TaxID=2682230 RepID=UPI002ADDD9F4|nr:glycosyltransferase family 4 protein [Tepidiforma sp.]
MVLFITRKFPPAIGGMEEFSLQLVRHYPAPSQLCALRRGQRWLPLFVAHAAWRCLTLRGHIAAIHLGDGLLTLAAPLFQLLGRAPAFVTVHGQDVSRRIPGYGLLLRATLRALGPERVVAVSSATASIVEARFGFRPRIIPNGVDVARFARIQRPADPAAARAALGLPTTGPLILTTCRLVERKGIAWFAQHVLPQLPGDVTFAVVGDGPEAPRLRAIAARDPRLRLLGQLPPDAIDRLYACADLFVAPNIPVPGRPEGFGIAPAEAAAAGLPVLAARLEGLVDMALLTGARLAEAANPGAWAHAVREALTSPPWPSHRPRDWSDVAADYARLFESATPARRRFAHRHSAEAP